MRIIYLHDEMQQSKFHIAFRGLNKPSKLPLRYSEALKHQDRLNYRNEDTRDNFRGSKRLIKVRSICSDVKVEETKFQCLELKTQKANNE